MGTESVQKDEGAKLDLSASEGVPSKPYSKLRRELADEDLSNGAVQKLLLGEIDRLEGDKQDLEAYEVRFHEADKERAILSEKLKAEKSHEVLYGICLTIGSALLGVASLPQLGDKWWLALGMGGVLIIVGVGSKVMRWK
jgi:hypothetical protein